MRQQKKTSTGPKRRKDRDAFSTADWRDIYDALMDAAHQYHSGSAADRTLELARRIREEMLP